MSSEPQTTESAFLRNFSQRSGALLWAGLLVALSQALIPFEEFINRGDDAYYYFNVAVNFSEAGYWTFDKIHETNGVQPLWAVLLTGTAELLSRAGVTDRDVLARLFVAITASFHVASSFLLYHLLRLKVSAGTGLVAAGAFLFPLGIVWSRTWGMENSLYAFLLLASLSYFHLRFLMRPNLGRAVVLGILLGLTVLARLNAALLIPCLIGWMILGPPARVVSHRWRLASTITGVAAMPVLLYFFLNYAATGYPLPNSGTVKSILTDEWLREHGIDSRTSLRFINEVYEQYSSQLFWFVKSRLTDPLWVVGLRLAWNETPPLKAIVAVYAALTLTPALVDVKEWGRLIQERYSKLASFTYFLVFALANAIVSIVMYPTETPYAIIRWWLVENEILIVVVASTLIAAALGFLAERLVPSRLRLPLATLTMAAVIIFSVVQAAAFYWDGKVETRDWNRSYNHEMYKAALWMEENLPHEAIVGSWNAGVLGYYAKQRVINLDGLINSYKIIPYLRERTIPEYILNEGIGYLSDVESYFPQRQPEVIARLRLRPVYVSEIRLLHSRYVIYQVLGPRKDAESSATSTLPAN